MRGVLSFAPCDAELARENWSRIFDGSQNARCCVTRRRLSACLVAAFLLAPLVGACHSYVRTGAPRDLLAPRLVEEVHLGRRDGRIVVLKSPTLVRDSVWGQLAAKPEGDSTGVALKDVEWAVARGHRASLVQASVLLLTGFVLYVVFSVKG